MVEVTIFEYERGYGRRNEGTRKFLTREKAEDFCKEYNKENNKNVVPDCYWKAEITNEMR